eukprot:355302-Chlamydomonas_euryale.AAC.1
MPSFASSSRPDGGGVSGLMPKLGEGGPGAPRARRTLGTPPSSAGPSPAMQSMGSLPSGSGPLGMSPDPGSVSAGRRPGRPGPLGGGGGGGPFRLPSEQRPPAAASAGMQTPAQMGGRKGGGSGRMKPPSVQEMLESSNDDDGRRPGAAPDGSAHGSVGGIGAERCGLMPWDRPVRVDASRPPSGLVLHFSQSHSMAAAALCALEAEDV